MTRNVAEESDETENTTSYGKGANRSDSTAASAWNSEYDNRNRGVDQAALNDFILGSSPDEREGMVAVDPDEVPNDAQKYVKQGGGLPDFEDYDPEEDGTETLVPVEEADDVDDQTEVFVPESDLESDGDPDVAVTGSNEDNTEVFVFPTDESESTAATAGGEGVGDGGETIDLVGSDVPDDMSIDEFMDELKHFAETHGVDPSAGGPSMRNLTRPGTTRDRGSQFEFRDGGRMGGWPEFNLSEISGDGRHTHGARGVEEHDFRGEKAYVNTNATDGDNKTVTRERVGYRVMEEMGVAVPQHEFGGDSDGEYWTAKREFDGEMLSRASRSTKENVNYDTVRDMMALNVMMGNWDPHGSNVMVNEEGDVRVIDFDRAADDMDYENRGGFEGRRGWREGFRKASRSLDEVDDSDRSRNDLQLEIHDRARELSREMVESGELDDVVAAAAEIDERAAKHIAKNVVTLATEEDNAPRDRWE